MDNRTKFVLFLGAALLCIGGAGVLIRTYMGSWQEEPPTTVAGPALTFQQTQSGHDDDLVFILSAAMHVCSILLSQQADCVTTLMKVR